jgi:hypothetical protein
MEKKNLWVKVMSDKKDPPNTIEDVVGYRWAIVLTGYQECCEAMMSHLKRQRYVCQILDEGKRPTE